MANEATINPNGLKILAANYLQGVDLSRIDAAWEIVTRVHKGSRHFSGELYVIHLLEVASTLASMHLDLDTILAGLLHGVLKEGDRAVEETSRKNSARMSRQSSRDQPA